MSLYVYAQNGISLCGPNNNTIAKGLANAIRNIDEVDYIIVLGGHNDSTDWQNGGSPVPIGENTDTTYETFKGGISYIITTLRTKYPNAQILFVTPYIREGNEEVYANAMKEVCSHRSIACFDSRSSGLDFISQPIRNLYELDGSKHFNEIGQERLSYLYESLLNGFLAVNTPHQHQIEIVRNETAFDNLTKNPETFYVVKNVGVYYGSELVLDISGAQPIDTEISLLDLGGLHHRLKNTMYAWVGNLPANTTVQFLDEQFVGAYNFAIGPGNDGDSTPWIGGGWAKTPTVTITDSGLYTIAFTKLINGRESNISDEEGVDCVANFGYFNE